MKNRLFSLLFAGIMGVLAVHAQTDYAKLGIERKVLFTMNKNEICTSVDTRNLQKGVNNIKFEMHVKDTIKGIYTYVFNGERILSNESTIVTAHEAMEDAPVRDSLILRYEKKDGCYINFGKETYGPYKQIYPQDWNKFVYVLDNGYYMHDADGMIYQLSAGMQGRTFFQSPNKKHTALVSSDNVYKIRLDNTLYTLDSVKNGFDEKNKNIADVYVFDDGSCVVGYGLYLKGDDMGVDYEFYGYVDEEFYPEEQIYFAASKTYYIKNGKVQALSEDEYFDFKELKIKTIVHEDHEYRSYHYEIDSYNGISTYYGDINLEDEDDYIQMVDDVMDNIVINIWDESHTHHFMTAKGWGYIYLDDKALKAEYPLLASRNTYVNAFRWVVVEGNEVVYYSYQIP